MARPENQVDDYVELWEEEYLDYPGDSVFEID